MSLWTLQMFGPVTIAVSGCTTSPMRTPCPASDLENAGSEIFLGDYDIILHSNSRDDDEDAAPRNRAIHAACHQAER